MSTEKEFTTISEQQKLILRELDADLSTYKKDNVPRRKDNALERLTKLETSWNKFRDNDAKLNEFNKDNDYNNRTYFTAELFAAVKKLYDDTKKFLQEYLPPAESLTNTKRADDAPSTSEKRTDGETQTKIEELNSQFQQLLRAQENTQQLLQTILEKQHEKEKDHLRENQNLNQASETVNSKAVLQPQAVNSMSATQPQAGSSTSAPQATNASMDESNSFNMKYFVKALQDKKNELEFPAFPADESEYRDWRQQVDIWVSEDPLTLDTKKLQSLKQACAKNEKAHALVRSFDISTTNFAECLKRLDNRFMVIRNVMFHMVDTLIDLPAGKGGDNLMKLHDVAASTITNMESLIRQHVLHTNDTDEMTVMKVKAKMLDGILGAFINRKLDDATCAQIASKLCLTTADIPAPDKILTVIETKFINSIAAKKSHNESHTEQRKTKSSVNSVTVHAKRGEQGKHCFICKMDNHDTTNCGKLLRTPVGAQRFTLVKQAKVCTNCLAAESGKCKCFAKDANVKTKCKQCSYRHHNLLHDDNWKPSPRTTKPAQVTNAHVMAASSHTHGTKKIPLLPTVVLELKTVDGRWIRARAFVDSGASHSFMTHKCAQILGLESKKAFVEVSTYCGGRGAPVTSETTVTVRPHFESAFRMNVSAYLTASLGGKLPSEEVFFDVEPGDLVNLKTPLADPDYADSREIDMILGTVEFGKILKKEIIELIECKLIETSLGFICLGEAHRACAAFVTPEQDLGSLAKFFEYELDDDEKEDFVENFYLSTVKRDETGYTVRIPWKSDKTLGESKKMTVARVRNMLTRMPDEMRTNYVTQCDELVKKGYMVPANPNEPPRNYIANFALKTNSLTTPVRLLFTCDQKTTNGKSVNDIQHSGPKLQNDLPDCILRFRYKQVALTADIAKMYLQIKLAKEDAAYQRTFIGRTKEGPLEEMELPTVIFGMRSAPFLALRTLLHIADSVELTYPEAAKMLREAFYVDDWLASFHTENEGEETLHQLINALKLGKFDLKKIASSHHSVLKNVPKEDTLESVSKELDDEHKAEDVKVLGIMWNKKEDALHYAVNIDQPEDIITKRKATSVAARIYDPTGCLCPALLGGKILIQEMWRLSALEKHDDKKKVKAEWDQPLPEQLNSDFKTWQSELTELRKVKIPRWVGHSPSNKEEMIIGFSDASLKAYGCVAYFRTTDYNGKVTMSIIGAKSRVTPLSKSFVPENKQDALTLPRLELMGATMLATYLEKITKALNFTGKVVAFTDSQITLAWIQGDDSRWNTFVENRVKIIKKAVPAKDWFYVNTKNNPADIASRVVRPSLMIDSEESNLWFNGPAFTHKTELDCREAKFNTTLDEKRLVVTLATAQVQNDFIDSMERCSSWTKSVVVMAFVLRYMNKLSYRVRCKKDPQTPEMIWSDCLSVNECNKAELEIIKLYQQHEYAEELTAVRSGHNVVKGVLKHLNPFIDKNGLLRVGGRLDEARFISENEKHPIILPKLEIPKDKSQEVVITRSLTRKIIDYAHLTTLHAGELKTLAFIRHKFFIPNARNAIRYVLFRCLVCSVNRATTYRQLMGNLPKECVNPAPVFYHTTTDYAGPIQIQHGRRGRRAKKDEDLYIIQGKAWIAVYCCRLTGAYHIEIVPDLTATACVDAFKRFVSTRGLPKTVTSDNSTTFRKTAKLLKGDEKKAYEMAIEAVIEGEKEIQRQFVFKKVEAFTNEPVLQWKFIPPLSPNFGGKHEAAIKQIKKHLIKVVGNKKLPFVTLNTVMKQIEAICNSRPLCIAEGTAFERDQILTPAHFWLGRPLTALPEPDYTCSKNLVERYQIQQSMVQEFWKHWHVGYFNGLQQLPKWTKAEENIKVGEIVLLKEDNTPPLVWRKARVTEVFPGKDSYVRVALTTDASNTSFKRSVRLLVRLPIVIGREDAVIAAGKTPLMPLVAPQQAPVQQISVQNAQQTPPVTTPSKTPKKGKAKKVAAPPVVTPVTTNPLTPPVDPPLRRSARIQGKSILSSVLLMLMCALAMLVPTNGYSITTYDPRNLTINIEHLYVDPPIKTTPKHYTENQSGLAYFYKRDILVQIGKQPIRINTELHLDSDIKMIQLSVDKYRSSCGLALWNPKLQCEPLLLDLKEQLNHTIMEIENRFRNAIKGEIEKEADVEGLDIVGSWADRIENDDSKARPTLSMKYIAAIEQSVVNLNKRYKHVNEALSKLSDNVRWQSKARAVHVDHKDTSIKMIGAYTLIMNQIKLVERVYQQVGNFIMEQHDWNTMLDIVNNNLTTGMIPEITPNQNNNWKESTICLTNGLVTIKFEIPIVLRERFTEYWVIPLPTNNSRTVPDITPQDVIVNRRLKLFLESAQLHAINDTMAMTQEPIKTMSKLTPDSDCAIAGILADNAKCPMTQLPGKFDVWMGTPLHNHIAFYSTEKKVMECDGYGMDIDDESGVLYIPPTCSLETATRKIISTHKEISEKRYGFQVIVGNKNNNEGTRTLGHKIKNTMATRIRENELEVSLKDAVNETQEFHPFNLTAIVVSTIILVLGLTIAGHWYVKKKGQTATTNAPEVQLPVPNLPENHYMSMTADQVLNTVHNNNNNTVNNTMTVNNITTDQINHPINNPATTSV